MCVHLNCCIISIPYIPSPAETDHEGYLAIGNGWKMTKYSSDTNKMRKYKFLLSVSSDNLHACIDIQRTSIDNERLLIMVCFLCV